MIVTLTDVVELMLTIRTPEATERWLRAAEANAGERLDLLDAAKATMLIWDAMRKRSP
jgi:hypothetical protein